MARQSNLYYHGVAVIVKDWAKGAAARWFPIIAHAGYSYCPTAYVIFFLCKKKCFFAKLYNRSLSVCSLSAAYSFRHTNSMKTTHNHTKLGLLSSQWKKRKLRTRACKKMTAPALPFLPHHIPTNQLSSEQLSLFPVQGTNSRGTGILWDFLNFSPMSIQKQLLAFTGHFFMFYCVLYTYQSYGYVARERESKREKN